MSKRNWIVNITSRPRSRDVEVFAGTPEEAARIAVEMQGRQGGKETWDAQWVEDPSTEEAYDVVSMCELSGPESPKNCRQAVLEGTDYHGIEDGGYLCESCSREVAAEARQEPTS